LAKEGAMDFAIMDYATGRGDAVYGLTMQDFVEMRKPTVDWLRVYKVDAEDYAAMDRLLEMQPPLAPLPARPPPPPTDDRRWQALQEISDDKPVLEGRPMWPPFIAYRVQHIKQISDEHLDALRKLQGLGWRVTSEWYGIADDINLIGIHLWPPPDFRVDPTALEAMRSAMP